MTDRDKIVPIDDEYELVVIDGLDNNDPFAVPLSGPQTEEDKREITEFLDVFDDLVPYVAVKPKTEEEEKKKEFVVGPTRTDAIVEAINKPKTYQNAQGEQKAYDTHWSSWIEIGRMGVEEANRVGYNDQNALWAWALENKDQLSNGAELREQADRELQIWHPDYLMMNG